MTEKKKQISLRDKRMETIRRIISASYGSIATKESPIRFERMTTDEKKASLAPYEEMITEDLRMIGIVLDDEARGATAEVFDHLRKADGADPEMIDQIMSSSLELGDAPALEVDHARL